MNANNNFSHGGYDIKFTKTDNNIHKITLSRINQEGKMESHIVRYKPKSQQTSDGKQANVTLDEQNIKDLLDKRLVFQLIDVQKATGASKIIQKADGTTRVFTAEKAEKGMKIDKLQTIYTTELKNAATSEERKVQLNNKITVISNYILQNQKLFKPAAMAHEEERMEDEVISLSPASASSIRSEVNPPIYRPEQEKAEADDGPIAHEEEIWQEPSEEEVNKLLDEMEREELEQSLQENPSLPTNTDITNTTLETPQPKETSKKAPPPYEDDLSDLEPDKQLAELEAEEKAFKTELVFEAYVNEINYVIKIQSQGTNGFNNLTIIATNHEGESYSYSVLCKTNLDLSDEQVNQQFFKHVFHLTALQQNISKAERSNVTIRETSDEENPLVFNNQNKIIGDLDQLRWKYMGKLEETQDELYSRTLGAINNLNPITSEIEELSITQSKPKLLPKPTRKKRKLI